MLYYLSTKENEEYNELFRDYLRKKTEQVSEWINTDLPGWMEKDEKVRVHLRDMETRVTMAIMDTNEKLYYPILICGVNEKGIRWNRFLGLPSGKEIVIIDEDGDKYSFEEFDELAGETCELTQRDEKVLSDIRASQNKLASDKWRMYFPPKEDEDGRVSGDNRK